MRRRQLLEGRARRLLEGRQTGLDYDVTSLAAVAFNSTIAGIESADAMLLVGTNPRWEAPLVHTRAAQGGAQGRARSSPSAPEVDLGMQIEWLGNDLNLLGKLPKEVSEAFASGANGRRSSSAPARWPLAMASARRWRWSGR